MTVERGVLDTSTVIRLGDVADESQLPDDYVIPSITLAELTVRPPAAADDKERAARQVHLQQTEADFDVVPFDASAARAFGGVAASLRAAGRKPTARPYDALIAATAIAHGPPGFTCNPADFVGIDGLRVEAVSIGD